MFSVLQNIAVISIVYFMFREAVCFHVDVTVFEGGLVEILCKFAV